MLPRTSAAVPTALAFPVAGIASLAAVGAARAQTTGREMFTPVQNDLALVNLRKLLGCVVDGVWSAATCSDDRPLTVALGYFNLGCLIVATILACYLLYSLVADTANDGQAFGRGSSARYTLLRAVTGAILSLPIKSGLSLVQILVVQIAVWGSGFGDTLWARVAGTQLSGMYGALATPAQAQGDFVLRGKLAQVLTGRLYGHVCAQALQTYAKNVSGGTAVSITSKTTTDSSWWPWSRAQSTTYHFADDSGYFRNSDNLCGGVVYEYQTPQVTLTDSNDSTTTAQLIALAEQQSQRSFQSAISGLDAVASSIATSINTGNRNDTAIKQQIKSALDSAYNTVSQSLIQNNNAQLQAALRAYLSNAADNGWLAAALWQRSMSLVQAKLIASTAGFTGTVRVTAPASIASYIPNLDGTAYAPLASEVQRNLAYVATFGGYLAAQGSGSVTRVTSDTASTQADPDAYFGKAIAAIYGGILSRISQTETTTWADPVIEVQTIGQSMAQYGLAATGGGVIGDFASWGISKITLGYAETASSAATQLSGGLYLLAMLLFAAAFLLIGLVPFIIIVHFLLATFNWFLVVTEAMIAVPIWLLTKFMPARSDSFVGNSGNGYMFFLGILLRPALIVVGLLAALLLMRVGIDIVNLFFRGALAMISPDGSIAYAMVGTAGLFVYAVLLFSIVTLSAGQISALPETVLSWIGGQIERRSGNTAALAAAGVVLPRSPNQIEGSRSHRAIGRLVGGARDSGRTMIGKLQGSGREHLGKGPGTNA